MPSFNLPELPEVETTRRALLPHILGKDILSIHVYHPQLRWHIDENKLRNAFSQTITAVARRSKYLILQTPAGFLLSHLGMSGHWKITAKTTKPLKHDHIQIDFAQFCLRYNDARRFGSFKWIEGEATDYVNFHRLGVEPVANPDFPYGLDAIYLKKALSVKKSAIKLALMDAKFIVGVGNIYANESLFLAGINPKRLAARISVLRLEALCQSIVEVLEKAIEQGGTTLKDFINPENKSGYFQLSLNVYGRNGEPCKRCQTVIKKITQAGRSTFYCPKCQT